MSATGKGLTAYGATLAAAGGGTSRSIFTHNKAKRAIAVLVTSPTTGSLYREGVDVAVTQPSTNVIWVDNLTGGGLSILVEAVFEEDSTQANLVASSDSRLVLGVGVASAGGAAIGQGAANRLAYWTGGDVLASDADIGFTGALLSIGIGAALAMPVNTPATFAAHRNNYALGAGGYFRIACTAPGQDITGIVAGVDGQVIILTNVGANSIDLNNADGASIAANRINTGTGLDLALGVDDTAWLIYDATSTVWRIFAVRG